MYFPLQVRVLGKITANDFFVILYAATEQRIHIMQHKVGIFQLSRELRNIHYHPRISCVLSKFPFFQAGRLANSFGSAK